MCMAAKCGVHYMAVKSISSFYHFLSQAFTFTHQTLRGHKLRAIKMADNNLANQTSSAEMVESNQDLLTQILLHFPVKSLLKSRCVSKRWLSLISDPQFAAKISHLNVNLGPSGLYFYGSPFGFLNFDTNHNMLKIEIFSSENKAWTDSGGPFEAPHYTDFEHGVFCNGAIHWLSPTDVSLYFDVETESLKTMAMPRTQTGGPSGYWSSQRFPYFGQCAGCLHLIEVDSISKPRFHILEMKPDHSHWCDKYRVNLNNVASEFPEIARRYMDEFPTLALNNVEEIEVQYYAYSILSVVIGEKDEDVEVVMVIPGKIISHNPRLNTSKLLSSWRANNVYDCMQYKWYNVFHYVESLATL
ncbi:hypothetical protein V6Z11_D11G321100 [Gossypium hirsutum]